LRGVAATVLRELNNGTGASRAVIYFRVIQSRDQERAMKPGTKVESWP